MKRIGAVIVTLIFFIVLAYNAYYAPLPDIKVSTTETVIIPGVEKEYTFLFLTDMHMAIKTKQDLGASLGDADERMKAFVNEEGILSSTQFTEWIAYANRLKPEGVLMCGDMIDYYSQENVEFLADNLQKLKVPYLYVLGNHEMYSPWNETIAEDAEIYHLFRENNTAFQAWEFPEFTICAVDNQSYQVAPEALAAMQKEIEKGKPIILLAHVPFYTSQIETLKEASINTWGVPLIIGEGARDTTEVTRKFMKMAFSDESPVVAVFTGDNHFYYKGMLTDKIEECVIDPSFAGNGTIIKIKAKE